MLLMKSQNFLGDARLRASLPADGTGAARFSDHFG
jgi:hypothetical protein